MVAPITGPFDTSLDLPGGDPYPSGFRDIWFSRTRTSYRQLKPYSLPLSYFSKTREVLSYVHAFNDHTDATSDPSLVENADFIASGYNKAYAKLVSKVGDASLWAVNLAEYRQSIDLIAKDGITLWKFARALHRFDFPGAARILKTQLPKGLKSTAKSFGNNFLKFHFGWEPLVNDIGAAVDTLQKPYPSHKRISGSSRRVDNYRQQFGSVTHNFSVVTKVRIQTRLSVANPQLFLASQLGFVNPLSVAWELVPFSFVVDWFVNVGQFLAQSTDFAGLSVSDSFRTSNQVMYLDTLRTRADGVFSDRSLKRLVYQKRELGLGSGPVLKVYPWKGFSPVRGATAIALLVQQLR